MSNQIPPTPNEEKTIKSYSGYHEVQAKIFNPQNITELQSLVCYFYKNSIVYSIMGTGLSFNNSFQHQHIICCKKLNKLTLDLENNRFIAQPGVTWGQVMTTLLPKGYVVPVIPTATEITLGGSFSCDTYSRMTATYGKEINQIISFKLLTPTGDIVDASRSKNKDLFYGAITGMGSLGIVVEIVAEVIYVGKKPAFCSIVRKFDQIDGLRFLQPKATFQGRAAQDWKGSCAVFYLYNGKLRNLLAKHKWLNTTKRQTTLIHQINKPSRILSDFLMHFFPQIAHLSWNYYYKLIEKTANKEALFIDNPYQAAFVMETNTYSKTIAKKLNLNLKILQITYAIPCINGADQDRLKYEEFIKKAIGKLKDNKIHAVMMDGIYVPAGKTGLFSSSRSDQESYLFTLTLGGKALKNYAKIKVVLEKVSSICYYEYDGKIHLTKNTICPKPILRKMYAEAIAQLIPLKQKYDPKNLLQNNMLNDLFDLSTQQLTTDSSYTASHSSLKY